MGDVALELSLKLEGDHDCKTGGFDLDHEIGSFVGSAGPVGVYLLETDGDFLKIMLSLTLGSGTLSVGEIVLEIGF